MNTIHPEDSLDNLSSLQINRQRQLLAQVKQQFTRGLQKLQAAETREIAIAELKKLIQHYRQQQYLRGYISILKTLKPNSSSATKQHQILVLSIIAQIYKDQLLDPIDKPPCLLKTSFRIVQILHSYFNDHSPTVQQACARALLDLNTHCLKGQTTQTLFSIIYAPLISILKSGVDKGSQATASSCLSELIKYNRKIGAQDILKRLSPELLSAILRINSEYHELFQAVLGMLQSQGLSFLEGKLVAFLSKMVSVIDGTREMQNSNTTNLNAYMCKVNVCKMIQKIGRLLLLPQKEKLFQLRIPEALQQAARHRIIQVQLAASKALKAWRGEEVEESPQKAKGLMSLEQKRNSKKAERSRSKEDRIKAENQLTFMKEDLQKMVKGGWGASNRAKNYVKRGSGMGGGHISRSELSPQNKSGSKSHKEHFEQLREFIKKGAQENKNIDRFVGLLGTDFDKIKQGSNQNRSKSPSVRGESPGRGSPPTRDKKQVSQGRKRQRSGGFSGDEIGFVEDEGDQMVYMPEAQAQKLKSITKSIQSQPKSQPARRKNRFEDIGISETEAMELMAQEKALLEEGKRMNINYTQMSEEEKKIPYQTPAVVERLPLREAGDIYTPQDHRQTVKPETDNLPTFKGLSQEQLGELVQQYNLSQVSENLNDVLTESDMKAFQSSKHDFIDSRILEPTQGKSEINALKDMVAEKKQRKSAVNKFFKRDAQPAPSILEQKQTDRRQETIQRASPAKQNLDQPALSLNFTESQDSRGKSPGKREDIQFTLNPKQRFSSVKEQPSAHQKQVEQEIAMSEYEQSFPRDRPLPIILPKIAPITQIPLRYSLASELLSKQSSKVEKGTPSWERTPKQIIKPQLPARDYVKEEPPEAKTVFQNLIKHPPRLQNSNEGSRLKTSKASEQSYPENSNLEQRSPQADNIGASWLQILDYSHEGEVNEAYDSVLQLDDPIYFLRLMLLSKVPVKKLSPETFQKVWRSFLEIYSQKFIDVLTVSLLSEGNQLGILSKCLSVEQLQEAMIGLYELSGTSRGKLSYKAATLYNQIDKKLHPE